MRTRDAERPPEGGLPMDPNAGVSASSDPPRRPRRGGGRVACPRCRPRPGASSGLRCRPRRGSGRVPASFWPSVSSSARMLLLTFVSSSAMMLLLAFGVVLGQVMLLLAFGVVLGQVMLLLAFGVVLGQVMLLLAFGVVLSQVVLLLALGVVLGQVLLLAFDVLVRLCLELLVRHFRPSFWVGVLLPDSLSSWILPPATLRDCRVGDSGAVGFLTGFPSSPRAG